jgi:hypothetical protein
MEHQFFIRQQNLKLYRSLVLKLLAEEVANEPPPRKN